MSQLEQAITRLQQNPDAVIKVVDLSTMDSIENNASADYLINKYGTVADFFETLYHKGTKKIKIYNRTNIDGAVTVIDDFVFEFKPKVDNPPAAMQPAQSLQPMATNFPAQHVYQATPVDMVGLQGLNAMRIYKEMDHTRLDAENRDLKAKVERLEKENRTMADKILVHETIDGKTVAQTNANAGLMQQFAPVISVIAEKVMATTAPIAAVGLSGANLSETKTATFKLLETLDDDTVYYFGLLAEQAKNEVIINDFVEFMQKHNLIQD